MKTVAVVFWLLVATALPSILFFAMFGIYGSVLAFVSMHRALSKALVGDIEVASAFAGFELVVWLGPPGLFALWQLTRLVVAVAAEGLVGIEKRKGVVWSGFVVGLLPMLFWLPAGFAAGVSGTWEGVAIRIVMSGLPMLPLVALICVLATRSRRRAD